MTVLLADLVRQPRWRRDAACRGHAALFFASDDVSERIALSVCAGCSVRLRCLAEALTEEADSWRCFGVRGGLTAAQRRALV